MHTLAWLMLLCGVLQTLLLLTDARPDGFNVYKGAFYR